MDAFNLFLEELGDQREVQLNMKELKNEFKLPKKNFPKLSKMIHYFKTEFSQRTRNESRTKWHNYDKQLLFWVVCKYCQLHQKYIVASLFKKGQNCMDDNDWMEISRILGVETKILKNKWLVMVKPQVKNAPWTQEEDQILRKLIDPEEKNHNWTQVATHLAEMTQNSSFRNAKQIRERWNNYLNPTLKKSEWEEGEDVMLLESVLINGKKWSQISQIMGCRTESQVKNRYNSISNRLKKTFGEQYPEESLVQMEINSLKGQSLNFSQHQNIMPSCKMLGENSSLMKHPRKDLIFPFLNNKSDFNSSDTLHTNNNLKPKMLGENTDQFQSPSYLGNNSFPQLSESLFLPDTQQQEIFINSQYLRQKKYISSPSHRFQMPMPPHQANNHSSKNSLPFDNNQVFSNQSDMSDFLGSTSTSIYQENQQQQSQQQQQNLIQLHSQVFGNDDNIFSANAAQQMNFLCPSNQNNNINNNISSSNNNHNNNNSISSNNLFIEDWGFLDNNQNQLMSSNNQNNQNSNNQGSSNVIITPHNGNNIFYPTSTIDFNSALQNVEHQELRRSVTYLQEQPKTFYQTNTLFALPATPHNQQAALSFFSEEPY